MELKEFTEKFADCFVNEANKEITASTEFKKLDEWGSMIALIVIAMVDSDYNKTLTAEDLRAAKTIEDLFDIIRKK